MVQLNKKTDIVCDAAAEAPRPEPRICKCQNGGLCVESDESDELKCDCLTDFHGDYCEIQLGLSKSAGDSNATAIVVPIVVILLVLGSAVGVWFFIRKRPL